MDQALEKLENENAKLRRQINELQDRVQAADKEHSILGHRDNELEGKSDEIKHLEEELDGLRTRLRDAVQQRQAAVDDLQRELERVRGDSRRSTDTAREELQAQHKETLQRLEDELVVLESQLDDAVGEKENLAIRVQELETAAATARVDSTPVRERNELRLRLRTAEINSDNLHAQIGDLETELDAAVKGKANGTPVKENRELKSRLRESEASTSRLQDQIDTRIDELEQDLEFAQQEQTLASERQDLHDLLKKSKIEAEDLQIKLAERERKIAASSRREAELKGQLHATEAELEDVQALASQLEARLGASSTREKGLRAQVRELKEAQLQLAELEEQLGDRQGSSSGHARREAELRAKLREARSAMEMLKTVGEDREELLTAAISKQNDLRERLKQARIDGTLNLYGVNGTRGSGVGGSEDLQGQLDDADIEIATLHRELLERDSRLQASLKREEEVKMKLKTMRRATQSHQQQQQQQQQHHQRRHQAELRGLAKQITFLRASSSREEGFRRDLIFTKAFFLKQVEAYNKCNNAQLDLLQDMGITPAPEASFVQQESKSLRPVIWAIRGMIRMKASAEEWRKERRAREALLKKLEGLKKDRKQIMA
ncbi:hypothetical protein K431DRAFT_233242 [Polychaeton citri CBS 116435]|uniref:Pericentrin/AKAP-450 centrosomal targeting domain-containing protein n=1 Tax=Polychaeton citri CBS 116435 TaxID=1314669 RepID=A0A9P4Q0R5_9PEZI|nr:hypothetical protein K431DRAFT_233242 [Polychaeton citri CBS 116435]